MSNIYALHDWNIELKKKGTFLIEEDVAEQLNKKGYGIFWTPNSFYPTREIKNLLDIHCWLADIDQGSKQEQKDRIKSLKIHPSIVIETKKGYHCYWMAKPHNNYTLESYRKIEIGIIEKLKADKGCKDVTRLLRLPNYYHVKDPKKPFKIKKVYQDNKEYTEEQMLFYFEKKEVQPTINKNFYPKGDFQNMLDENKWDKIFNLKNIGDGNRNNEFARIRLWLKDQGLDDYLVYNMISKMNLRLFRPLPEWELRQICRIKG